MSNSKRIPWNKGKKEKIKHVYYTNGEKSIRIPYNEEPPNDFVRGRIRIWSDESKKLKSQKNCTNKIRTIW